MRCSCASRIIRVPTPSYRSARGLLTIEVKRNLLKLVEVVIEQDADILGKIYPNTPQHIKLNNEVGMDWVRRNFDSYPKVCGA